MARRRRRTQWLSVGLLWAATSAAAPPPATPVPSRAAEKKAAPEKKVDEKSGVPDAALLLYMSEFEDAQGEWIDPADLPPPDADPAAEDDDDAS
jgi:hypothetical protein